MKGWSALSAVALLAGCSGFIPTPGAPPECGLPAGSQITFTGFASLNDVGLEVVDLNVPHGRKGDLFVAAPLTPEHNGLFCLRWPDSNGPNEPTILTGPVPDGWTPPDV